MSPSLTIPAMEISPDAVSAGTAAAAAAAEAIREAVEVRGRARVLFASAPSQSAMLAALAREPIVWSKVEALHLDEYVGLDRDDPRAFGNWLRNEIFDAVSPGSVEILDPSQDPVSEAQRYADVLARDEIDVACIGIGNNGHIAFNEPYQWSTEPEPAVVQITLDEISREQQVLDKCFATIEDVPRQALTLSVASILRARRIIVTAAGAHKQAAVSAALVPGLTPACPATALQLHPTVTFFIDTLASTGP